MINIDSKKIGLAVVLFVSVVMIGCGEEDSDDSQSAREIKEAAQYESYSEYANAYINVGSVSIDSPTGDIEFHIDAFGLLEKGKKYTFSVEPYFDMTNYNTAGSSYVGSAKFECNGDADIECVDVAKITCDRIAYIQDQYTDYICYLNGDNTLDTIQTKKTVTFSAYTHMHDGGQYHRNNNPVKDPTIIGIGITSTSKDGAVFTNGDWVYFPMSIMGNTNPMVSILTEELSDNPFSHGRSLIYPSTQNLRSDGRDATREQIVFVD